MKYQKFSHIIKNIIDNIILKDPNTLKFLVWKIANITEENSNEIQNLNDINEVNNINEGINRPPIS